MCAPICFGNASAPPRVRNTTVSTFAPNTTSPTSAASSASATSRSPGGEGRCSAPARDPFGANHAKWFCAAVNRVFSHPAQVASCATTPSSFSGTASAGAAEEGRLGRLGRLSSTKTPNRSHSAVAQSQTPFSAAVCRCAPMRQCGGISAPWSTNAGFHFCHPSFISEASDTLSRLLAPARFLWVLWLRLNPRMRSWPTE